MALRIRGATLRCDRILRGIALARRRVQETSLLCSVGRRIRCRRLALRIQGATLRCDRRLQRTVLGRMRNQGTFPQCRQISQSMLKGLKEFPHLRRVVSTQTSCIRLKFGATSRTATISQQVSLRCHRHPPALCRLYQVSLSRGDKRPQEASVRGEARAPSCPVVVPSSPGFLQRRTPQGWPRHSVPPFRWDRADKCWSNHPLGQRGSQLSHSARQ